MRSISPLILTSRTHTATHSYEHEVAIAALADAGLPPLTEDPSLHKSDHPTSLEYMPPATLMVSTTDGTDDDDGGGGDGMAAVTATLKVTEAE